MVMKKNWDLYKKHRILIINLIKILSKNQLKTISNNRPTATISKVCQKRHAKGAEVRACASRIRDNTHAAQSKYVHRKYAESTCRDERRLSRSLTDPKTEKLPKVHPKAVEDANPRPPDPPSEYFIPRTDHAFDSCQIWMTVVGSVMGVLLTRVVSLLL